ncbi:MAG: hypothetical protein GC162_00905 [Planctomycetes bacterium]|nr:hypothetical protein [Planctomycetota bacterium]
MPTSSDATFLKIHLAFLHFLFLSWGIHLAAGDASAPIDLLFRLSISIIIVLACAADARRLHLPLRRIVRIIMLFTWPLTVPIYLIWSRRWRGLLWLALWSLSLTAAALAPYLLLLLTRPDAF